MPGSETNQTGYVLVSKCPESWMDINTKINCEIKRDITDVIGLLPVYDSHNLVYKNIWCARCHGKETDDVTFWNVSAKYDPWSTEQSGFVNNSLFEDAPRGELLFYFVSNSDASTRPRTCPYGFVDECPPESSNKLSEACKAHFAPFIPDKLWYDQSHFRNHFCAICNGVIDEHRQENCRSCQIGISCRSDPFGRCFNRVCTKFDRFLTVETLFNFEDLQRDAFGKTAFATCNDGFIYDPFSRKCRSLSCPVNYIIHEGTCQPDNALLMVVQPLGLRNTDLNSTSMSVDALDCILDEIGLEVASIEAIQVVTKELQQYSSTCFGLDITCETKNTSTVSLTLIFQSSLKLNNFNDKLEPVFKSTPDNVTSTMPICNVDSISMYMKYPIDLILPLICTPYVGDFGDEFDFNNKSKLLLIKQHKLNKTDQTYYSVHITESCIKDTTLDCNTTVIFDASEFVIVDMDIGKNVHLIESQITLKPDEYIRLSDGRIKACPFSPLPHIFKRSILDIAAAVCGWFSVAALICTLTTYLVFPKLRNLPGKIAMSLAVALMLAYLGLLLAGIFLFSDAACTTWAILTHYFWLTAFFWMALCAFDVARTFSQQSRAPRLSDPSSQWRMFLKYSLIGWSTPVLIIVMCLGLHFAQFQSFEFRYGSLIEEVCFLRGQGAVLYTFVIPISTLVVASTCLFLIGAVYLRRQRQSSKIARAEKETDSAAYEVFIYLRVRVNSFVVKL